MIGDLNSVITSEINYCTSDIPYFIERYVKIEDRDVPELVVPFSLWPDQKKVLKAFIEERLNIVLKARQLGLTWLALSYAVHQIIFNAGYQVVALSKTEDDAKELTRRIVFILSHLPRWLIREDIQENSDWKGIKWKATSMSVTIMHSDKEPSIFNSFSASPNSARSFTANLLILDEWAFQNFAREIWAATYPTVNRPTGGKVIGLSTAKRLTLFQELWLKAVAKLNSFNCIFLSWRTDPRRTQAWYDQTKRDLGELKTMQEYPNTPEEAFQASEDTAFTEFSYATHVCEPFNIPDHWLKWRCSDNGYTDPFAWYWMAVSEQGQVFIYREYTRTTEDPKVIYSKQAEQVVLLTKGEVIEYTVPGMDAWSGHVRDVSNKTLIDYYHDGGLFNFIKPNTDRKLRKSTWHEYLRPYFDEITGKWTAKVQIFSTCYKLIETLPQLLCDEKDNEKVAECDIDHWYDGAGYGLISYHSKHSEPKKGTVTDTKWTVDMIEDYENASDDMKERMIEKYGEIRK